MRNNNINDLIKFAKIYNKILKPLDKEKKQVVDGLLRRINNDFKKLKEIYEKNVKNVSARKLIDWDYLYPRVRELTNDAIKAIKKIGNNEVIQLYRKFYNGWSHYLTQSGFPVSSSPPGENISKMINRYKKWIDKFDNSLTDYEKEAKLYFKFSQRLVAYDAASEDIKSKIIKSIVGEVNETKGTNVLADTRKYISTVYGKDLPLDEQTDKIEKVLTENLKDRLSEGRINVSNDTNKPYYINVSIYAETWAMDMMTDASMRATFDLCEDAGLDLVYVPPTPKCCDVCASFEDKVYSLDGKGGYPMLDFTVPLHPRCEHLILPYDESFGKWK